MRAMEILADGPRVAQLIDALAAAIRADVIRPEEPAPWALVGLRSRGDVLARRIAAILQPDHVGTLDFTLYRDDLAEGGAQTLVRSTEIDFPVDGLNVVLVDDVLMTGRSVRAALQSLIDLGRPRRVWLSVLVDRGGRELPIAADHVALDLTGKAALHPGGAVPATGAAVSPDQIVEVQLAPTDPRDAIVVRSAPNQGVDQ